MTNNWLATKFLKIGTDSPEEVQLQHTTAPKLLWLQDCSVHLRYWPKEMDVEVLIAIELSFGMFGRKQGKES